MIISGLVVDFYVGWFDRVSRILRKRIIYLLYSKPSVI